MSRKQIKNFLLNRVHLKFHPTAKEINTLAYKLSQLEPLRQEDFEDFTYRWRQMAVNANHGDWTVVDEAFRLIKNNRGIPQEIRDMFLKAYEIFRSDEGTEAWHRAHSRRRIKMTAEEMDAAGIQWRQPEEEVVPPYWTNVQ